MTSGSDPADPRARARNIVAEVLASAAGPAAHAEATPVGHDEAVEGTGADPTEAETAGIPTPGAVDDAQTPVGEPQAVVASAPRSAAGEAAHRIVLAALAARREAEVDTADEDTAREEEATDGVAPDDAVAEPVGVVPAPIDDERVVAERVAEPTESTPEPEPEPEPEPAVAAEPESVPVGVAPEPEPVAVAAELEPAVPEPEPAAVAPEDRMRRLFAATAPEPDEDEGQLEDEPDLVDGSDVPWSLDADLTSSGTAPSRTGRWLLATILGAIALALLFPLAVAALRQVLELS